MVRTLRIWQELETLRKKNKRNENWKSKVLFEENKEVKSPVYLSSVSKIYEFLKDVKVFVLCGDHVHNSVSLSQNFSLSTLTLTKGISLIQCIQ